MRVIADDLWFPEGPVWVGDGSLLVVEIRRQTLTRIWLDGRKSIVAKLGGGPNGAALGPDGYCYVVNNGGSAHDVALQVLHQFRVARTAAPAHPAHSSPHAH